MKNLFILSAFTIAFFVSGCKKEQKKCYKCLIRATVTAPGIPSATSQSEVNKCDATQAQIDTYVKEATTTVTSGGFTTRTTASCL